jgi:pimeloyl-ACP methyl ester carboxylesterase
MTTVSEERPARRPAWAQNRSLQRCGASVPRPEQPRQTRLRRSLPLAESASPADSGDGCAVRLDDGRRLGFVAYGEPSDPALLYFHGHPGSRLEARFLADAARRAGLRLIGLDRPGLGLSDHQPRRRLSNFSDDVLHVINRLGLQRVAIIGYSGGAPYALDCTYRLSGRVTACAVVSAAGEVGPLIRMLASWMPWPLLLIMRRRFADQLRAQESLERAARRWPEPDQRAFQQPGVPELLADSLAEAFRQGVKGAAQDGSLLGRRWTIPLDKINGPVHVWHGERDSLVPISAAHALADRLPHATRRWCPDDGHISTIVNQADAIVATLMTP